MYSELLVGAGLLFGAVIIWLGVLTFLVLKDRSFLKSLFPKSGERDVRKKIEEVLKEVGNFGDQLKDLDKKLIFLGKESLGHIQKVAVIRYNPFGDTGGDISFSAALLDNYGTGIVITSLHGRSGTRIFAKPVKIGLAESYELSKEEKIVIKKALDAGLTEI